MHVDNEAVANVINSGKSRDTDLQNALREIALIAARHQFVIKARHIPGVDNRVPDWLSRWDNTEARRQFRVHIQNRGMKYRRTNNKIIEYEHVW